MVGRAEVDVRCNGDGRKIEDKDGGQSVHPYEFSNPKSNKFDIFINVRRNW